MSEKSHSISLMYSIFILIFIIAGYSLYFQYITENNGNFKKQQKYAGLKYAYIAHIIRHGAVWTFHTSQKLIK